MAFTNENKETQPPFIDGNETGKFGLIDFKNLEDNPEVGAWKKKFEEPNKPALSQDEKLEKLFSNIQRLVPEGVEVGTAEQFKATVADQKKAIKLYQNLSQVIPAKQLGSQDQFLKTIHPDYNSPIIDPQYQHTAAPDYYKEELEEYKYFSNDLLPPEQMKVIDDYNKKIKDREQELLKISRENGDYSQNGLSIHLESKDPELISLKEERDLTEKKFMDLKDTRVGNADYSKTPIPPEYMKILNDYDEKIEKESKLMNHYGNLSSYVSQGREENLKKFKDHKNELDKLRAEKESATVQIKDYLTNSKRGQEITEKFNEEINNFDHMLTSLEEANLDEQKNLGKYMDSHGVTDENAKWMRNLMDESKYLKGTRKQLEALKDSKDSNGLMQFFKEFGRNSGDMLLDMLSLGGNSMVESFYRNKLTQKERETGFENLSPYEQGNLRSQAIENYAKEKTQGGRTVWQDTASGVAESIPFMTTFIPGMGVANVATKAPIVATKAAIKRGVKRGLMDGFKFGFEHGKFRWNFGMTTGRALGATVDTIDAMVKSGIIAGISPATYGKFYDNMSGQAGFDVDENGQVVYTGQVGQMSFGEAAYNAFATQMIENLAEQSGLAFAKIGKGAKVLINKRAPELGRLLSMPGRNQYWQGINKIMKAAGWNGTAEEFLEEQVSTVLNAFFTGEAKWSDLLDPRQQLVTFLTVAAIGSGGALMNSAGNSINKSNLKRSYNQAETAFSSVFKGNSTGAAFRNALRNGTVEDAQGTLTDILLGDFTNDQKKTALQLYVRSLQYQTAQGSKEARQELAALQAKSTVDEKTNPATNSVMEVKLAGNENPVRVVDGGIVMDADGNVDLENSSKTFYYTDENGNNQIGTTSEIESVSSNIPYDTAVEAATLEAVAPVMAQQENEEVRPFEVGEVATVDLGTGVVQGVVADVNENGSYMIDVNGQQIAIEPRQIVENIQGIENGMLVDYYDADGNVQTGEVYDAIALLPQGYMDIGGVAVPIKSIIGASNADIMQANSVENATLPPVEENILSEVEQAQQNAPLREDGKIDFNSLLDQNPTDFAVLWEDRSGIDSAKGQLQRVSDNLNKEIENEQKKIENETDLNKISDIEDNISALIARKKQIDEVINNRYNTSAEETQSVFPKASIELEQKATVNSGEVAPADIERSTPTETEVDKKRKPLDKGIERINAILKGKQFPSNEKDATSLLNEIARFRKNANEALLRKTGEATAEELDWINSLDGYIKDNFGLEISSLLGKRHNSGDNVDIRNFTSGTATEDSILKDRNGDTVSFYSHEIKPQIMKNGVLHQEGVYDVIQDVSQEDVDRLQKQVQQETNKDAFEKINNETTQQEISEETETSLPEFNGNLVEFAQNVATNEDIKQSENKTDTNPTPAQKEAGNYKKGHVKIQGLNISIENPKGSVRSGVDENGNEWRITMNNPYGYIRGSKSRDGEQIDVFIGNNPENQTLYIVDQIKLKQESEDQKIKKGFINTIVSKDREAGYEQIQLKQKGSFESLGLNFDIASNKGIYYIISDGVNLYSRDWFENAEQAKELFEKNISENNTTKKDIKNYIEDIKYKYNSQDFIFDEHKVMLGFNSIEEAREAYLSNYTEGWGGLGNITPVHIDDFKKWIKKDGRRIKPFSEYTNQKAFDSTRFQVFPIKRNTLVGIHNISEYKLDFAQNIGGLANPSMAVIDTENNPEFTSFGEISLIASPEMIEKKTGRNAGTFGADIYSPRYPHVEYIANKNDLNNFIEDISVFMKEKDFSTKEWDNLGRYDKSRISHNLKDKFSLSDFHDFIPVKAYYIERVKGEKLPKDITITSVIDKLYNNDDYNNWIKGTFNGLVEKERIFVGYSPSGNRNYKTHTLENVSKIMKRENIRGGENFYYGLGSIRAEFTPRFTTLNQIRNAKNRIQNKSEFEKTKKEFEKEYYELYKEISKELKRNVFPTDTFAYYVIEGLPNDLQLSDEFRKRFNEFRHSLSEMPTEYFETKFDRPVYLNEFSYAVVPNNISSDTRDILEKNKIDVVEYDPNIENDRVNKIKNLPDDVFFQIQENQFTPINESDFNELIDRLKQTGLANNVVVDKVAFDARLNEIVDNDSVAKQTLSEMESIKQNSIANGTFMQAPNGEPTNLNENQWLQVRTRNFKSWFGDWENNPENASKVVDENGEPLVVYHGTNNYEETRVWSEKTKDYHTSHDHFTVFKQEYEYGYFFNSDYDNAGGYGSVLYEVFLNLKNPFVIDAKGSHFSDIKHNDKSMDTYEWAEHANKEKYDGVIFKDISDGADYVHLSTRTNNYVAFNSTQIKSAISNNGAFDSSNPDIRMQVIKLGNSGKGIEFTRKNISPKRIYNSFKNYLEKEGVNFHVNFAKTGSIYLTFDHEGASYDIRIANHTPALSINRRGELSVDYKDEFNIDETGIYGVSLDLSLDGYNSSDLKSLVESVSEFNNSGIMSQLTNKYNDIQHEQKLDSKDISTIESTALFKYNPDLAQDINDLINSEFDKEQRKLNFEIAQQKEARRKEISKEITDELVSEGVIVPDKNSGYNYTASNGYTVSYGSKIGGKTKPVRREAILELENIIKSKIEEKNYDVNFERLRFMETNGDVYGFVDKDGTVYIDSTKMNANTPIHEFGHLWNSYIKEANKELYNKGAELIQDSPYWDSINNNPAYSDLSHDRKIDEALAMAIGDKGELVINKKGLGQKLLDWLNEAWQWVGEKLGVKNITSEQIQNLTLEQFTDVAVSDLLSGRNLNEQESKQGNDIAYQIVQNSATTDELRDAYDEKVNKFVFKLQEAYQDKHLAVKEFLNLLRENGVDIPEMNDYWKLSTHLNGKNDAQLEQYEQKFHQPMIKAIGELKEKGFSYRDIENYVMLKHGLERNDHMRNKALEDFKANNPDASEKKINSFEKKLPVDYSGISTIEQEVNVTAQDYIDNFETQAGKENIDNLWSKIKSATNNAIQKGYEGGLVDKATRDEIFNRYKYFVPLRGHDAETAEDRWDYSPDMGTYFVNPLVSAKGRTSRAATPFAYIFSMNLSSIGSANRNVLNQSILRLARQDKTGLMKASPTWYELTGEDNGVPVYEVASPVYNEDSEIYNENIQQFEERMKQLESQGFAYKSGSKLDIGNMFIKRGQKQQHEVHVFQNGKEHTVYFNGNPAVPRAINGLNVKDNTLKGFDTISKASRAMAMNFTTRNPVFVATNFSRDIVYAASTLPIKEGAGYTAQFFKNIPDATGALQRYLRGQGDLTKEQDRFVAEYITNGGRTGFSHIIELQKVQRRIERELKKGDKQNFVRASLDFISTCNEFAENLTRFSVYVTSRRDGRSVAQSITDAKEVTVNFNRSGAGGYGAAYIRSLYLFVNAGVQALANFGGIVRKNPGKAGVLMTTYALFGGFITPMLNSLLGGDDEYWKLSDWERQNNWCIYTGKGFIKIPLPHELRVFNALGDNFSQAFRKKKDFSNALLDSSMKLADLIPANPFGVAEGGWAALTPDALKPLFQHASNRNFMGSRVYNQYANENLPGYLKVRTNKKGEAYVPVFLVELFKSLDQITDGDGVERGYISINPDIAEHYMKGYFGGLYTLASQVLSGIDKTVDFARTGDFDLKIRETPLRTFYTSADDLQEFSKGLNNRYYNIAKEVQEIKRKVNGYGKQFREGKIDLIQYSNKINELGQKKALRIEETIKRVKRHEGRLKETEGEQQKFHEREVIRLKEQVINLYDQLK